MLWRARRTPDLSDRGGPVDSTKSEPSLIRWSSDLYDQVVIFVKSVARAVELDKPLRECSFPCIIVHSNLNQEGQ